MTLTPGTRLGPYQVTALIGAGGMGEVYKARDTRLDRTVAIKVLPPDVSSDPDRRARFEREAKMIAGLTHPHVCTLYDVGEHASTGSTSSPQAGSGQASSPQEASGQPTLYLVMEHLAGETLAERLHKGPLPLEQLEAKPADARTDLWALGVILYEMVTGRRAFEGASAVSLIANIMNAEPAGLTTLQPLTPPALDRLVRRCLAKDPDARWYAAHDVADELRWIAETPVAMTQRAGAAAPRRTRERMPWACALAMTAVAAGILVWGVMRTTTPLPPRVTRSVIPLGPGRTLTTLSLPSVAFSHDGTRLAYAAQEGGGPARLYLRALDQPTAVPRSGTEGAVHPFFSPDGQWVAFIAEGKLKKISLSGGAPLSICEMGPEMRGANWGQDGTILFTPSVAAGVWRVSAAGGTPQVVTTPDVARREKSHRWPEMLPGGKAALMTVGAADISSFDAAPDGRRFVMIAPDESRPAAAELNLVQNWFEDLKAKVPRQ